MNKKTAFAVAMTLSLLMQAHPANAQTAGSVYSIFGIGELVNNGLGTNRSLGGTGIAFQSGKSMNYLNPAAYLGVPPNSLMGELGLYGVYNNSKKSNTVQSSKDINFSYFSLNVYCTEWWALSFGVLPFSRTDYEIESTDQIGGDLTSFKRTYKGYGGLSRTYLGNSFKIIDGLAAGFNLSYMGGTITELESASGNNKLADYELVNEHTGGTVYLDYGLQYSMVDRDWLYTLGLIYGASTTMNMADNLQLTSNGITTSLEQDKRPVLKMPQKFGLGVAAKTSTLRAGLDYEWENWSAISFSNPHFRTKNSNRYSIGLEYSPPRADIRSKIISYRVGANYRASHLKVDNTSINSFGMTVGIGMPFESMIANMSVEYGQEGTLSKGLIKNSYWMLYLNVSIVELWSPFSTED